MKAKRTSVILSITYESNQCRYYTGIRTTKGFECAVGPNFSLSGVGLAFAVGYNFKSGNLNIPINLAFIPGINKNGNYRDNDNNSIDYNYSTGNRIYLMVGFNMNKKKLIIE